MLGQIQGELPSTSVSAGFFLAPIAVVSLQVLRITPDLAQRALKLS